jgi:hypothetical protein
MLYGLGLMALQAATMFCIYMFLRERSKERREKLVDDRTHMHWTGQSWTAEWVDDCFCCKFFGFNCGGLTKEEILKKYKEKKSEKPD